MRPQQAGSHCSTFLWKVLHFSQIREKHQILDTVSFLCWRLICSRRNTRWQWKSTFSNWVQQAYRINLKWALPFKSREPLFSISSKILLLRAFDPSRSTFETDSTYHAHTPTTLSWKHALPDPSTSMGSWRRPSSPSLEKKQIEFKSFDWIAVSAVLWADLDFTVLQILELTIDVFWLHTDTWS